MVTEYAIESFLYGVFDMLASQESEELADRFDEAALNGAEFGKGADVEKALGNMRWETFAEAGVLTQNKGIVARFGDGSEFQITIVQSRRG